MSFETTLLLRSPFKVPTGITFAAVQSPRMALSAPVHWTRKRIGIRRPYCSCNSVAVHGSPYRQRIALVIEQKIPYHPVIYAAPIAGIEILSPFSDGVGMRRRRHVCEGLDSLKALASIAG